jgi:endonuclease/exonuclease/phosphatase family metal-dependent hydrolase
MKTLRAAFALALALACSHAAFPQAPKQPTPAEKPNTYTGKAAPAIGVTPAPKKAAGSVRLAAFNVENLFDDQDDPTLSGEYDDIKMTTDPTRLQNLAAAIKALDADVLALEEVESEQCLRWFRDTYLKDLGYAHLASKDVGYYRGIEQGVLSRLPIEDIQIYRDARIADAEQRLPKDPEERKRQKWATAGDLTTGFQRSPLHVRVRLPDGSPLELFVLHLKSGPKKDFSRQREMEALTVVNLLDALRAKQADAQIAVVGDFNATPNEMAVKALRDKSLGGLVSAYELRPGAGKGGKQAKDDDGDDEGSAKGDRRKYLTHSFVPDDKPGKPIERTIDYILLSPSLFKRADRSSFFVLGLPKPLNPGSDKPAGYASDHCPVAVDLKIGAKPEAAKPEAAPAAKPAAN